MKKLSTHSNQKQITIAIDAMGGDHGLSVTVPAAIAALKKHPNLFLVLVGDEVSLKQAMQKSSVDIKHRFHIHHASQVVAMDELPSKALRSKKDSSLRVAINLVKQQKAQACVSAGNTGALMATARFVLKMIPGIDRPAIFGRIPAPNQYGYVRMLDLGANCEATAEQLVQFGVMASVLTQATEKISKPRVALLNIGEEEIKGNESIKKAGELFNQLSEINYVGFVEGNGLFADKADVIVCDGFAGNIALKTMEGVAGFIRSEMVSAFKYTLFSRVAALMAWSVLKRLRRRLNPERYNGASFLGLQGIVIKSHGSAKRVGFLSAIERAMEEVEHNVVDRVSTQLEQEIVR